LAIGIGGQWGKGVLNFQGVQYPFKISGFSVIDVGFTSIDATGAVYNLNKASDFAGTYTAGAAGIAVGGGAGAATMKNQNGVSMSIKSKKAGIQLTLAAGGVTVTMLPVGDTDGDGITDEKDQCADTRIGVKVDEKGCPFDYDGDGVAYYLDECADTPKEAKVDEKGCPVDSDGDGVADYQDECPGTPKSMTVNITGCWIAKGLEFDSNKWEIKPKYYGLMNKAVRVFQVNPALTVEIVGHTDNTGSEELNQKLSEKRANAVRDYFIANGIASDRLTARGMGEKDPIASNDTPEGRAQNRRIEFIPSKR
jgi:OOP family OmpA-OmpF porin